MPLDYFSQPLIVPLPTRTWSTLGNRSAVRQLVLGSWNPCSFLTSILLSRLCWLNLSRDIYVLCPEYRHSIYCQWSPNYKCRNSEWADSVQPWWLEWTWYKSVLRLRILLQRRFKSSRYPILRAELSSVWVAKWGSTHGVPYIFNALATWINNLKCFHFFSVPSYGLQVFNPFNFSTVTFSVERHKFKLTLLLIMQTAPFGLAIWRREDTLWATLPSLHIKFLHFRFPFRFKAFPLPFLAPRWAVQMSYLNIIKPYYSDIPICRLFVLLNSMFYPHQNIAAKATFPPFSLKF